MHFGEWLRSARKAANLTQDRLAELVTARGAKISAGYISNLERAYDTNQDGSPSRPSESIVNAIAVVLGQPLNTARLAAGYAPIDDNSVQIELEDGVRVSMFHADKYTDEDRRRFQIAFQSAYETALRMIEEDKKQ